MNTIRLIGRNSRLSLLQMERVQRKIEAAFPEIEVKIIARNSRGDMLPDVPLHTVEGSDFFTQDIFDALANDEADIAVHSLKDMSSEHFFGSDIFAVTEREDVRDVAIFREQVKEKIRKGETVIIGTCSPRREEMAISFLQKALPQWNEAFRVETKFIRGNVDTRLRKLDAGEYDGIILATAGLNRLLSSETDAASIRNLLKDKKLMLLPLIECVPAPCQGAIVAEANPKNKRAVEVLKEINDTGLMKACIQEKKTAVQYGTGCLQKFGVTTISYSNKQVLYAAGEDANRNLFSNWVGLPEIEAEEKILFNSADYMGSFFTYEYLPGNIELSEPVVYIANYKAVQNSPVELLSLKSPADGGSKANSSMDAGQQKKSGHLTGQLQQKKVWASGTKTWFELAKQGIWVEGCADAFGLEFLDAVWNMPLVNISKKEITVLTHKTAAANWQQKGWNSTATYILQEPIKNELTEKLQQADIIFWTSFQQYQLYKNFLKEEVVHVCSSGETASLLSAAGIKPVLFPNIKAFQQWRKTFIRSHSGA